MIIAAVNKDLYRYEIQALIREFLPGNEVKVRIEESDKDAKCKQEEARDELRSGDELHREDGLRRKNNASYLGHHKAPEEPSPILWVSYEEKTVQIRVEQPYREHSAAAPDGIRFDEKGALLKSELKHLLYDALSEYTKRTLPWGELIGIRPTKLATRQLAAGRTDDEAEQFLMDTYRVSKEKAQLSTEIAKREKEILGRLTPEKGYSLYIGVPFCPTTCLYCSFPSYAIGSFKSRVDDYLTALEKEMAATADMMRSEGGILDTVYVGGGTPTTLEPDQLDRLLTAAEKYYFDGKPVKTLEFTVEAGRPDSITAAKLEVLKAHGVDRMSVNPQTMNDRTLELIGRRHSVQQVIDAFYMAREAGMDNINMDIILGLPGENDEDVQRTIDAIERLSPDDLTVHSLAVKRGSRMAEWIEKNGYDLLHTNNTENTIRIAEDGARRMGLKPYYLYRQKNMSGNFENVGYAREGKYGIYNILIIEEIQSILALGPGSVTKRVYTGDEGNVRILRCDDAKDVPTYLDHLDEMIERKQKLFAAGNGTIGSSS